MEILYSQVHVKYFSEGLQYRMKGDWMDLGRGRGRGWIQGGGGAD